MASENHIIYNLNQINSLEQRLGEELLLVDVQNKSFLEIESLLVKNVLQIVDMTTKKLEYYINLVDKAV